MNRVAPDSYGDAQRVPVKDVRSTGPKAEFVQVLDDIKRLVAEPDEGKQLQTLCSRLVALYDAKGEAGEAGVGVTSTRGPLVEFLCCSPECMKITYGAILLTVIGLLSLALQTARNAM